MKNCLQRLAQEENRALPFFSMGSTNSETDYSYGLARATAVHKFATRGFKLNFQKVGNKIGLVL